MRGPMLKILACLLAVICVTMAVAEAGQRTGRKKAKRSRPDLDKAYSLNDIMKDPKVYLEREVFFYCRFATTANLFKNINTRFNVNEHVNFAVWPDKTVLWEEKGRKTILPTLYVSKIDPENLEIVREIDKYELIAVTGRVLNVYAGYPWILVTKLERVEVPSDKICDTTIEHMQSGYDALKAESGGAAARHFEQALQAGIPKEYQAKAFEQLAQAYLLDNRLDKAREYLRQSVEADRSDAVLHLALADVALKMGDAGEALAHCEFALEASGRHPQVYGIMGEARAQSGDYVKAFNDLNIAAGTPGITAREKAMVNVRRARIYVKASRFPDAARVYAAASEPGEPLAGESWLHNEIGLFYERLYLETGDERYLDSAYSAYEEASKLSRLDAAILYNMTETEFRRQRLNVMPNYLQVKDLIERINQVEPDYTPARILEGRILFAEEKIEEAEHRYQSVVNHISNDPISLMALAEAYIDLGRYMDAAKTVKRARRLQPWNPRVQALGKFLEETAENIAKAEAETRFDGWLNVPQQQQPRQQQYQRYEPLPEPQPVENIEARYARPRAPQGQRYANAQRRPAPGADPRIARGLARRPVDERHYAPADPYRPTSQPRFAEGRPPHAEYQPQGTQVRVRPGEGIRAGANGVTHSERREYREYPQDIQTSAGPAVSTQTERKYPVTEVRLGSQPSREPQRPAPKPLNLGYHPGSRTGSETVAAGEPEWRPEHEQRERSMTQPEFRLENQPRPEPYGSRQEYDDRRGHDRSYADYDEPRSSRPAAPEYRENRVEPPRFGDQRYDAERSREAPRARYDEGAYHPRERYPEEYRDYPDDRSSRYDRDLVPTEGYRTDDRRERDAGRQPRYQPTRPDYPEHGRDGGYDSEYGEPDGHRRYGQIIGSGEAYASIPVFASEEQYQQEESGLGIPEAFSFSPDTSPVIIAGFASPADSGRDMPIRNVNVYRPLTHIRQPAEIIEKEQVDPRGAPDTSVMAPPGSGEVRRTEVHLPSSSQGIGMTSDYHPGN